MATGPASRILAHMYPDGASGGIGAMAGGGTMRDLLTTKEAASRLGVAPRTLQAWVQRGWIRAIRLPSGRLRFRVGDLDSARREVGGSSADREPVDEPHPLRMVSR